MSISSELPENVADLQAMILRLDRELGEARQQFGEARQQVDEIQVEFEQQERVLNATEASYEELRQTHQAALEELDTLRRWMYGRRSERIDDPNQLHLFDLGPALVEEADESDARDDNEATSTKPRKRRRKPRALDLDKLPHERIRDDVSDEQKRCGCCGREMEAIGIEESKVLEFIPASLKVIVHERPKYACGRCKEGVTTAPAPRRVLPRCIAGPGLIAQIVVGKFGDHLPLYRLEDIFRRNGLHLARSTLCDWAGGAAELLRPLYDLQKMRIQQSPVMWTDDTTVTVLNESKMGGSRTGRFWIYLGDAANPYSVFDFTLDRTRNGPAGFLASFKGYLHADAFAGYDGIYLGSDGSIIEVACWAHARRKFFDAKQSNPRQAHQILEWIRQLYDIEDRAADLNDDNRRALRQAESVPILDRVERYLEEIAPIALPKSALGKAVTYARNQWQALRRYVDDGRLTIDNNLSERTIRPLAIGRKNWLFVGNRNGGERAAILFTILAGAKRHRIEPWAYLHDVLSRITDENVDLEFLLPDRWAADHPQHILRYRIDEADDKRADKKTERAKRRQP